MKSCLIILMLVIGIPVLSQDVHERWTAEQIEKANTGVNAFYLSDEEKKVILLSNLVRMDGQLFAETILTVYLKDEKPTRYTRSLYRELKDIKDLPMLKPKVELHRIAKQHAVTSGERGTVGHQRFENRFEPLMGKYKEVAENCAYGYERAIDIVVKLLIDEEIPDLGHRRNLLNPNFDSIGISIQPHKKFRHNCVMDFGALNTEK